MAVGSSLVVGAWPRPLATLTPPRKRAPIRSLVRSLARPTCLKEWAPVVQAVHNGKQTVSISKVPIPGGINIYAHERSTVLTAHHG